MPDRDPMDEKLEVLNSVRKIFPSVDPPQPEDRLRRPSEYLDYLIKHWDEIDEREPEAEDDAEE